MPENNFTFTADQINHAVENDRLLSMEIEPSMACNYQCLYCYATDRPPKNGELSFGQLCEVIMQAKELGARKIVVLGGEPLMYPKISELIDYIYKAGLTVEMFTNGSLLTKEITEQMVAISGRMVVKLNSMDSRIHNMLCRKENAFDYSMRAIELLKQAGALEKKLLAVACILSSENKGDIFPLWQWCRENNIVPYFETITPQGRIRENPKLMLKPSEIKDLFEQLSQYDAERNIHWQPQPPIVAQACLRHRYSCLVTIKGTVYPCVGISETIGDIKKDKLADILEGSEILDNLKFHRNRIKGHCGRCEKSNECYGCRGAAYQMTGDYLAADPLCWHNCRAEQPQSLPIPVEGLIPHKKPMQLIDRLVEFGDRRGVCESKISKDNIWLSRENTLSEAAYVELAAQTTAAVEAFMLNGEKIEGALVGIKRFTVIGQSGAGDTLRIEIFKRCRLGQCAIVDVKIMKAGDIIAEGEIKVWQET